MAVYVQKPCSLPLCHTVPINQEQNVKEINNKTRNLTLKIDLKTQQTEGKVKETPIIKTKKTRDFPGGRVVKNRPFNAGDTGSIPGRETKIPQTTRKLSLHAVTAEPTQCI